MVIHIRVRKKLRTSPQPSKRLSVGRGRPIRHEVDHDAEVFNSGQRDIRDFPPLDMSNITSVLPSNSLRRRPNLRIKLPWDAQSLIAGIGMGLPLT